MDLDLQIPKEPKKIKTLIKSLKKKTSSDSTTIDFTSLNVWFGNQLPKYFWQEWKNKLKPAGFNWQKFLKILKNRTDQMVLWADDKILWREFVKEIIRLVNGPLGEQIVSQNKKNKNYV